jgi:hypothetical protein|tara:strand:+ start:37 stop:213 length:177 start_codon:yes stop_codon:yes gene_type:complete
MKSQLIAGNSLECNYNSVFGNKKHDCFKKFAIGQSAAKFLSQYRYGKGSTTILFRSRG